MILSHRMSNPYVGPRPFQTGETLYGRDREVLDLLDLLIAERIVLLYSPSGAGKTSLIQAGLLPELEQEDFQPLPVMRVSLEPPPEQAKDLPSGYNRYILSALMSLEEGVPAEQQFPLAELAEMTLAEYWERRKSSPDVQTSGSKLKDAEVSYGSQPASARLSYEPDALAAGIARFVLIFDQFEEILTADPTDRAVKNEFFAQLGAALRDENIYALFAMREEFPAGLDPYLRLIPTRLNTTFRLELLGVEAACQAMQQPAQQAGIPFTNAAANKLIDDLRATRVQQPDGATTELPGMYVEPVQLQVVCYRLWEHLPEDCSEIEDIHLQQAGDVNTALAGYYADRVATIAQQAGVRERTLREWFDKHLITEQGIRGQVLRGAESSKGLENKAITPLVDAHLVRAENRRGATWYELAHDRLIEPIRTDNAAWFQAHLSALQRQAELWEKQNRASGFLLDGDALKEAECWAATHAAEMTAAEQDFLAACQEAQRIIEREERQNRRIRRLAIAATIISIAAVSALFAAYYQRSQAERLRFVSIAQSLAAQALHQTDSKQDERGLLLARQAYLINQRNQGYLLGQIDNALRTVVNAEYFSYIYPYAAELATVALSPDGKTIAVGGGDGVLHLRSLRRLHEAPTTLRGHEQMIWSIAFSPDGQTLASSGHDRTIRLWSLDDPALNPITLHGHASMVFAVAFSPDGQTLASGSLDQTVRLWNLRQPETEPLVLRGHAGSVNAVAFSPDGNLLASGSSDQTIRLWDVQRLEPEPLTLRGHAGGVNALAFSPEGQTLISGGADGNLNIWRLSDPASPAFTLRGHAEPVLSVSVSPDGQFAASGSWDKSVRLWNLHNPGAEPVVLQGHEELILALAFSPNGRTLASASADKTLRLWNLDQSTATFTTLPGHQAEIAFAAFSEDSQTFISADTRGLVRQWEVESGQKVAETSFAPSSASAMPAYAPETSAAQPGEAAKGTITQRRPERPIDAQVVVALSPDRTQIGLSSFDGTIRLWEFEQPEAAPRILSGHAGPIRSVIFSSNRQMLASVGEDKTIRVWDLHAPEPTPVVLKSDQEGLFFAAAFSPDGKILAAGSSSDVVTKKPDNVVRLWDLRTPQKTPQLLEGHAGPVTALAFSPDGKILASGSADRTIRLWRPQTRRSAAIVLRGHREPVTVLAFSPDGKVLASGSTDQTVRLWDLHNPQGEPIVLSEHNTRVKVIAFSPDGKYVASGAQNGTLLFWLRTAMLSEAVCQRVQRNLTQTEWSQFVGEGVSYERTCPELPEGEKVGN